MPTFLFGRSQAMSLDNSSGTPVDIAAYVVSISLDQNIALLDKTTLGLNAIVYQPGLASGQLTLSMLCDATIRAQLYSLKQLAATSTFAYGPGGTTSGFARSTGECRVASIKEGGAVGDLVKLDATLQLDGAVTNDTY
jgi:hypothetical protein